jgi:ribosome-associated protein
VWNVRTTQALDEEARTRVQARLASRIDNQGCIRVVSSARRSQSQNREAAEERLAELVRAALMVPKKRRPTKPSKSARQARLTEKKKRGETKRQRRADPTD